MFYKSITLTVSILFFEIDHFEFLRLFLGAHFFQRLDPQFLTIFVVSFLFGSFQLACVNLATMNPSKQFSDLPKERKIISKFLRFRQHPYFSSFKMAEDQLGNHLEVTPG